MDASVNQQSSVTQQPNGMLAGLQVFGSIFKWLAGFIQVTEDDLENAGIYFGE